MSLASKITKNRLPKLVEDPIDPVDFIYLVKIVAFKFLKKTRKVEKIEDSEPYSVALLELVRAASKYDSSINGDFSRYAFRVMCNGVIQSFRRDKRQKRTAAFKVLSDKEWREIAEKQSEDCREVLHLLLADSDEETVRDKQNKAILRRVYLEGQNISAVAEEYGITRMSVYNRLNCIIANIRNRHPDLFGVSR